MKKNSIFTINVLLIVGSMFAMINAPGQEIGLMDARTAMGENYLAPEDQQGSIANRNGCFYFVDDGIKENSIGLTSGGDLLWLNYFTATPGCELIHTISLTWGQISNGGPCRVFIYDDPDDDGNPDDAVLLTEAATTVVNANTNNFTNVSITPTLVNGGFFVGAAYQNHPAGEYPGPLDQTTDLGQSWVVAEMAGMLNVTNLSANVLPPMLIGIAGFPGNWLLRAEGGPYEPTIPISNWAVLIGVLCIVSFSLYQFRKRIF